MTRDEIKQVLLDGGFVYFHVWTFGKQSMSCSAGCCDDYFDSVEEAMSTIESYCDGNFEGVGCYD